MQAFFPSKCPSRCSGFRVTVPTLYYESVDGRWKHHAVYPEESNRKSTNAGKCP